MNITKLIIIIIYIYLTACLAQLDNSSDTHAVGHIFEHRPDH